MQIKISDENDNSPKFLFDDVTIKDNSEIIIDIHEELILGSVVFQISAKDDDINANGEVIYEISSFKNLLIVESINERGKIIFILFVIKICRKLDFDAIENIKVSKIFCSFIKNKTMK